MQYSGYNLSYLTVILRFLIKKWHNHEIIIKITLYSMLQSVKMNKSEQIHFIT
ncbi:MAG: hypothetical protein JWR67_905 [Mucilaginibacter sp.]|nr:hypothetical protein [Mucilaginibacter sp.]